MKIYRGILCVLLILVVGLGVWCLYSVYNQGASEEKGTLVLEERM